MFKKVATLFLYTETPLHAGSGTSLGIADLPIQREKHTELPMVQASGLKGVVRDFVRASKAAPELVAAIFGPETDEGHKYGGCLSFSDARLLLFPVRSLQGVFGWVTCPLVLERFKRDMSLLPHELPWELPIDLGLKGLVAEDCDLLVDDKTVVFEEYSFPVQKDPVVAKIAQFLAEKAFPTNEACKYWRKRLYDDETTPRSNLVILSNDDFRDFTKFSTEILTRIRIEQEKGTVATGALWTEEHLPSETLLYSLMLAADPKAEPVPKELKTNDCPDAAKVLEFIKDKLAGNIVQVGGDETVGRGLVRLRYFPGGG